MTIKELKERLHEDTYVYVAVPNEEVLYEFTDIEKAHQYAQSAQGIFWDHYPYEEYGFEDPYAFTYAWTVVDSEGYIIDYIPFQDTIIEVTPDAFI